MYESVIKIIQEKLQTQIEGEIMRVVQAVGVNVDKDELIKALAYDRQQYEKGYADAKEKYQRPHGKWRLNDDGSGTCLNCNRTAAACWDYDNALSYCPHCGVKMDDIEEDGFDDDFDPGEDWEADRCYECGAYGDDYSTDENGEMVCNCDRCPYNSANKED